MNLYTRVPKLSRSFLLGGYREESKVGTLIIIRYFKR